MVTRRDFLTTAASTAAAITIVPRHVLGRGVTPPSDKLNIAVCGIGGMGRSNALNVATQNIVALCDVDWDYAGRALDGVDTNIQRGQGQLGQAKDDAERKRIQQGIDAARLFKDQLPKVAK